MSRSGRLLARLALLPLVAVSLGAQDAPAEDPLLAAAPAAEAGPGGEPGGAEAPESFEALFRSYVAARDAGDTAAAAELLQRIRRLRAERNISSLRAVALGLTRLGVEGLEDDAEAARASFEEAAALDPHLPEAQLGLARTGGFGDAAKASLDAFVSRVSTSQGRHRLVYVLVTAAMLAAFAATTVFALVQVVRVGPLLRHDLEEAFGSQRPGVWATGAYALLLLLPLVALQGYGWLPLWWLGLLFVYMGGADRAVSVLLMIVWVFAGPAVRTVEPLLAAGSHPLLRASLATTQLDADPLAAAIIEQAVAEYPEDRDFGYLLAEQYKKAGRYEEAGAVYRRLLEATAADPVALNNLGNLEILAGDFGQAKARYDQAAGAGPAAFRATAYYNKSLAQLQEFDFDPARATRAEADGIAPGLPAQYERRWYYVQEGSVVPAVVDLGPSDDELWAKFSGITDGAPRANLTGSGASALPGDALVSGLMSRFAVFVGISALAAVVIWRWRGDRLFTLRCLKCGTPFCKLCHLGTPQSELCTQCHHLFVVRDGVSAPARNRKMAEVAEEESRRRRMFRILSLVSPGAGHVHARKPILGVLLALLWYGVLGLGAAAILVPVVASPGRLANPVVLGVFGTLLLVVFLVANLVTPSFETRVSMARRGGRRPQPGRRS